MLHDAVSDTPGAGAPDPKLTQQGLTISVFNPGEEAIFAVSSVLVEGKNDAILIDAQFSAEQARKLADKIRVSGKLNRPGNPGD